MLDWLPVFQFINWLSCVPCRIRFARARALAVKHLLTALKTASQVLCQTFARATDPAGHAGYKRK